jgi:hypothetical protein
VERVEGWDSEESPRGIFDHLRALDKGILPSSARETFLVSAVSPATGPDTPDDAHLLAESSSTLGAELADLESHPDSVVEFVRKHGPLGYPVPFIPAGPYGTRHRRGEPLSVWLEATGMHRVVWRELHGRSQREGESFELTRGRQVLVGNGAVYREYSVHAEFLARRACPVLPKSPALLSVLVPETGDAAEIEQARSIAIARIVSAYLNAYVRGTLLPAESPGESARLVLEPMSLLGAAWLQIARDLEEGNVRYGRCLVCGTWFKTTEGRSQRMYCASSTCRGRAFRAKRDRCLELSADGTGAVEVARIMSAEFGETITAHRVRNWIEKSGGT